MRWYLFQKYRLKKWMRDTVEKRLGGRWACRILGHNWANLSNGDQLCCGGCFRTRKKIPKSNNQTQLIIVELRGIRAAIEKLAGASPEQANKEEARKV